VFSSAKSGSNGRDFEISKNQQVIRAQKLTPRSPQRDSGGRRTRPQNAPPLPSPAPPSRPRLLETPRRPSPLGLPHNPVLPRGWQLGSALPRVERDSSSLAVVSLLLLLFLAAGASPCSVSRSGPFGSCGLKLSRRNRVPVRGRSARGTWSAWRGPIGCGTVGSPTNGVGPRGYGSRFAVSWNC